MQQKDHEPVYLVDYVIPSFLIETIDLKIELDEEVTEVTSLLQIHRNPKSSHHAHDLILNGEDLVLKSLRLNGKLLDPLHYRVLEDSLTIFAVPEKFSLEIVTWIKPQENTQLNGLYKSNGNFCTQCEAQGFRRITYFLDRPDIMALYTTTIIANEKQYPILLSNGNLIDSGKMQDGKHWAKWEDPFKKPSYLFALVAGDFEFIEDFFITQSGRRIELRIYVEKGNRDKCDFAMQAVKKAMRWDEKKYGREYDLNVYMIVAVSDFNMGAMENKGLNIFNTKYILAKPETATDEDFIHVEAVIAHEYFHNWTGNRITCRDWFQLSLKEGLTIFRDQNFTADMTSKNVARIHDVNDLRTTQFVEDGGPLSHPVRPEMYIEINNFYTATVYNKGAEIIRMMLNLLGEDLFRRGMDLYFDRHDGQAVTIEEFVRAMEDASKIDLKQFRRWYSQSGTPILQFKDEYDSQKKTYALTIKQTTPPTLNQKEKLPLHIPIKIGLLDAEGHEVQQKLLELKETEQTFLFTSVASEPVPSLLRGFSAPVKVDYAYSDAMLEMLFKYDNDEFNRWEAGQKYAINVILGLINQYQQKKEFTIKQSISDTYKHVLETNQDALLLSELLLLPSERYLAEQMSIIDVDAIHAVREFLLKSIATSLQDNFLKIYRENNNLSTPYQFTLPEVAKRRLRNTSLLYLTHISDVSFRQLALQQFHEALSHNMTDTMAAFRCLANIECEEREIVIREFYNYWQHEPLVVDKWFSVQAESPVASTLKRVETLLHHPAFDIKNPNKVYALLTSFCFRNPVRFHAGDGTGYALLGEMVLKLDALNPSVASRMVKPLTDWRRYDNKRQQLMRAQLERIVKDKNTSKDVYELTSRSLESGCHPER